MSDTITITVLPLSSITDEVKNGIKGYFEKALTNEVIANDEDRTKAIEDATKNTMEMLYPLLSSIIDHVNSAIDQANGAILQLTTRSNP